MKPPPPALLGGPEDLTGPGLHALAAGVWVTSGRAAVVEGPGHLALIDPGDEPCGSPGSPAGPLAEALALERRLGKPLAWLLVTHGHPDHVANLDAFRRATGARVVAHRASPLAPEVAVEGRFLLGEVGLEAIPGPGHSPWGDDLSFWHPRERVLFSGDLVQPKGEGWERAFYPSPYPFFTHGGTYRASLARLAALPVEVLVTGHREVRRGGAARRWIELTDRAIGRVGEAVAGWSGPGELAAAAPELFRALCRERGIPLAAVEHRLDRTGGPSAFERFDLPGIAYYWHLLRP
ncbi:MAG: MBL fold metallo-hydrolase [Deferrisomatales bacterium]